MNTKLTAVITNLSLVLLFTSPAYAASEADLRRNCEQKRDANACFEVGMSDVRKNTPASRKVARQTLKRACAIQKGKSQCSKDETKNLAKAFLATHGRVPASKSMIKAPKITNPGSRMSNSPVAAEPPRFEAPPVQTYEPASPTPAAPPMTMPMPKPPTGDNPGSQCMPGDPSCVQ